MLKPYLDLFNRSALAASDAHTAELQARIRRLQRAIEEENSKPPSVQRTGATSTFSGELADAEREYSELVGLHADVGALSPLVPEPTEVERDLPDNRAVIEYVVGPQQIAIFVLRHDGLHAKLEPLSSGELESKITLLRDLVRRPQSRDWERPARSLRRLLVGPIEKADWLRGANEIVIVPHGLLHYVPFATRVGLHQVVFSGEISIPQRGFYFVCGPSQIPVTPIIVPSANPRYPRALRFVGRN